MTGVYFLHALWRDQEIVIDMNLEYADLSSVADFEGTKWKDDEDIGDGGMDYVWQDSEGTWLDVV